MRTLTNDYLAAEVWDLDPAAKSRGPFLVTQMGLAPGSEGTRPAMFILRPDGRWADLAAYLSTGRSEALDEAVFESTQQIVELFRRLPPEAQVAHLPISEAGLRDWLAGAPPGSAFEKARRWLAEYRERRRQRLANR